MATTRKAAPYHHGDLREALVKAGRSLLEEKGWRGFTLRECARRASVSHAAPAYHFASLDDLLAEIARRGSEEMTATMEAEARRAKDEPAARLVGQCVGYMAFAAANPRLFELIFARDAERGQVPALATAVAAVIPHAKPDVKARMTDFAWATVHGFIVLMLEGRIGAGESSRGLKTRSLALLAAMVETILREGGVPD
ncbi:MAG TPA: TetR/AcrR family transcriptional regulator [Reyranella sp.]|nr:TetR/AcrR family transcriptional regulator [Reyranella sp.]